MTLEVRLRPEAELDLADAALWYEAQRSELRHQFLDESVSTFSSIAEAPLLYPIVHRKTRRALIHRFPFGVYSISNSIAHLPPLPSPLPVSGGEHKCLRQSYPT